MCLLGDGNLDIVRISASNKVIASGFASTSYERDNKKSSENPRQLFNQVSFAAAGDYPKQTVQCAIGNPNSAILPVQQTYASFLRANLTIEQVVNLLCRELSANHSEISKKQSFLAIHVN